MIKIEKQYSCESIFSESQDNTWDKKREKIYKVSLFGLTIFKRIEHLDIDYENIITKKPGFRATKE